MQSVVPTTSSEALLGSQTAAGSPMRAVGNERQQPVAGVHAFPSRAVDAHPNGPGGDGIAPAPAGRDFLRQAAQQQMHAAPGGSTVAVPGPRSSARPKE
jgi:hypothetical protein